MPKGLWRRVGNTAVPADARSLAFLQARKEGVAFIADTNGARNPKQLALWWSLCNLVCEAEDIPTPEKVSHDLKIALGHVDTHVDRMGDVHLIPKSIAFESMGQEDFDQLFKAAIGVISGWLAASLTDVMDRFNQMTADKRYEGMRR
jgi:hypothetical protein